MCFYLARIVPVVHDTPKPKLSDTKKRKKPAVSDWLISLVFKNRINLPRPAAAVTAAAVYAA